jgi:DoxX-like family
MEDTFMLASIQMDAAPAAPVSKTALRVSYFLSGFVVLFLLFDIIVKLVMAQVAVDANVQLGYPIDLLVPIGVIELICVVLYVMPRTSVLGALLLTGYLGGAIASQLRAGNPLFSHALFPIYVAAMVWGGLYLRDARLRQFLPLRRWSR